MKEFARVIFNRGRGESRRWGIFLPPDKNNPISWEDRKEVAYQMALDINTAHYLAIKSRKDHMTTTSAAILACVSPSSLLRAVKAGQIASFQTPGGHHRVDPDEVVEFFRSDKRVTPLRKKRA